VHINATSTKDWANSFSRARPINPVQGSLPIGWIIPGQGSSDKIIMRAPETRHSRWVQIHAGNRHPRRDGNQSGKQLEYCWCKSDLSTTIPPAVASAGTQDTDSLANCVSAGAGRRDRCVRTRQIERCVTPDFMTQKRTVKFVFLSRIMPHKNQTGMDSTQFSHRPLRRPHG